MFCALIRMAHRATKWVSFVEDLLYKYGTERRARLDEQEVEFPLHGPWTGRGDSRLGLGWKWRNFLTCTTGAHGLGYIPRRTTIIS